MGIDFSSDHGQRALRQLQNEQVVWMTTVGSSSQTPQPNLVWFQYLDGDVILYTKPDAARLRNIEVNPHVSLNFDSGENGEQMTIFTGTAVVDPSVPAVVLNPEYIEKYALGLEFIGQTAQSMSDEYSVAIRITLEKLRGW